ncbi:MAG TPA: hypothetical protein VHS97_13955 [Isosphaeraceae bacterium]|nr:hypothetical protein [Isosphaeraceae bacterium]
MIELADRKGGYAVLLLILILLYRLEHHGQYVSSRTEERRL